MTQSPSPIVDEVAELAAKYVAMSDTAMGHLAGGLQASGHPVENALPGSLAREFCADVRRMAAALSSPPKAGAGEPVLLREAAELADEIWASLDEVRRETNLTDSWYSVAEIEGQRILDFARRIATPEPRGDGVRVTDGRAEIVEECSKVAADWLNNWAGDLYATFESYVEAQTTGKHNGRRINPGDAKMYAGQFRERAEAVAGCADEVAVAIRSLSKPRRP